MSRQVEGREDLGGLACPSPSLSRGVGHGSSGSMLPFSSTGIRFHYGTNTEPTMPTLTIKGLPDPLYRRLKQQAEAHRRSLNGEIIVCLERAVGAGRVDPRAWLAQARAFRERLRLRPLTDRQLRAARQAGRA